MAKRGKLTRDQIVKVAMDMLDAEGEAGFSMRKLAARLKVDPMAIYHHHANRNALIVAVMQAFMDDCALPAPSGDWRADIRSLCQSLRALAKRHPGIFRLYETYDDWLPAENRVFEAFHATLLAAGFAKPVVVRGVRLLFAYTEAFAVDEISGWHDPLDAADQAELLDMLTPDTHPTMIALIDEIGAVDADADFAFGLNVLIRGLDGELTD